MNQWNANVEPSSIPPAWRVLTMPDVKSPPAQMATTDTAVKNLTQAIIAGNREALAVFYHQYFRFIYTEATKAGNRDESTTLDIVHDVMLRIIRTMKIPFQSQIQLQHWIRRIVYSVTYDHYRKELRNTHKPGRIHITDNSRTDKPLTEYSPLDDEHLRKQLKWLHDKIKSLDDHQSTLIVMRYRFNWTLDKIAESFGLSTGTIDGRIRRILAKWREDGSEDFKDE